MDNKVSPIPGFITTSLGQLGAWLAAALMTKGLVSDDHTELVVGAVVAVGTLAWRLISTNSRVRKLNDAIAAPAGKAK